MGTRTRNALIVGAVVLGSVIWARVMAAFGERDEPEAPAAPTARAPAPPIPTEHQAERDLCIERARVTYPNVEWDGVEANPIAGAVYVTVAGLRAGQSVELNCTVADRAILNAWVGGPGGPAAVEEMSDPRDQQWRKRAREVMTKGSH
jgi:hypothetical protein